MAVKTPYPEVVEISSDSEDEEKGQDLEDSEEEGEEDENDDDDDDASLDDFGFLTPHSHSHSVNPTRTWKQKWGRFCLNLKWCYGMKSGWTRESGERELLQNWYGS